MASAPGNAHMQMIPAGTTLIGASRMNRGTMIEITADQKEGTKGWATAFKLLSIPAAAEKGAEHYLSAMKRLKNEGFFNAEIGTKEAITLLRHAQAINSAPITHYFNLNCFTIKALGKETLRELPAIETLATPASDMDPKAQAKATKAAKAKATRAAKKASDLEHEARLAEQATLQAQIDAF